MNFSDNGLWPLSRISLTNQHDFNKMTGKSKQLTNIIVAHMAINGEVSFKGETIVSGKIKGTINGDDMVVTATGMIDGDLTIAALECHGRIRGNIDAQTVVLGKTAHVRGEIKTNGLQVEQGACLDCRICKNIYKTNEIKTVTNKKKFAPDSDVNISCQTNYDPKVFFPGAGRQEVLNGLLAAINNNQQLIRVYGKNGCGKTFICKSLQNTLSAAYEIICLSGPVGSIKDILMRIVDALELPRNAGCNQADLLNIIKKNIRLKKEEKRPLLLLLDEAEKMYPATLEGILKHLTELYSANVDTMKIVLFACPHHNTHLDSQILHLQKELSSHFDLYPLTLKETKDYIGFRLNTANLLFSTSTPYRVPMSTVKKIHAASNGIMGKIDSLVVQASQKAQAKNSPKILPRYVDNN